MRILIPVDGSRHSNAALAFAAARSTLIGTQPDVELINVQLPIPSRAARFGGREMVRSFHEAEAGAVLRPALAKLKKAGITARARYVVGSPGAAVGEAAAGADIDLVVMGSHGYGALKSAVLGSVATRVAARCSTPLLLIREK